MPSVYHASQSPRWCPGCEQERPGNCFSSLISPMCRKCTRLYNEALIAQNPVPEGQKFCVWCKTPKLLKEFGADSGQPDGKCIYCLLCARELSRARHAANPELSRRNQRRHNYGITDEYDRLFEQQEGKCAICRQPEPQMWKGRRKNLAVDHDHKTGRVRALLCSECNTAYGLLHEDPQRIRLLLDYALRLTNKNSY